MTETTSTDDMQVTMDGLVLALVNRMHRILDEGGSLDQLTPLAQGLAAVNAAWHHLRQGDKGDTLMQAVGGAIQLLVQRVGSEAPPEPYVPPARPAHRVGTRVDLFLGATDFERLQAEGRIHLVGETTDHIAVFEILPPKEEEYQPATDTDEDYPGRLP